MIWIFIIGEVNGYIVVGSIKELYAAFRSSQIDVQIATCVSLKSAILDFLRVRHKLRFIVKHYVQKYKERQQYHTFPLEPILIKG